MTYLLLLKSLKIISLILFHTLAAQSFPKTSFDSPIETLNTNIMGTLNLLESIRFIKSKDYDPTIHICSSSEVYGKAEKNQLLNERSNFHAASPYSLSKIGTDYLGQFYAEAYGLRTFVTRMGTHTGRRRSDVFFESTVAKQIALIENNLQEPVLNLGNLESVRTFQDCRDAVRAYYKLLIASSMGEVPFGECFNIAGNEAFKLDEVVNMLINMSTVKNINIRLDPERLRPVDADYQMFDNSKLLRYIDWSPTIKAEDMFLDLLNYWRDKVNSGDIPLSR